MGAQVDCAALSSLQQCGAGVRPQLHARGAPSLDWVAGVPVEYPQHHHPIHVFGIRSVRLFAASRRDPCKSLFKYVPPRLLLSNVRLQCALRCGRLLRGAAARPCRPPTAIRHSVLAHHSVLVFLRLSGWTNHRPVRPCVRPCFPIRNRVIPRLQSVPSRGERHGRGRYGSGVRAFRVHPPPAPSDSHQAAGRSEWPTSSRGPSGISGHALVRDACPSHGDPPQHPLCPLRPSVDGSWLRCSLLRQCLPGRLRIPPATVRGCPSGFGRKRDSVSHLGPVSPVVGVPAGYPGMAHGAVASVGLHRAHSEPSAVSDRRGIPAPIGARSSEQYRYTRAVSRAHAHPVATDLDHCSGGCDRAPLPADHRISVFDLDARWPRYGSGSDGTLLSSDLAPRGLSRPADSGPAATRPIKWRTIGSDLMFSRSRSHSCSQLLVRLLATLAG